LFPTGQPGRIIMPPVDVADPTWYWTIRGSRLPACGNPSTAALWRLTAP
jgi:hypothetical protein